jgi:hypothetical protein
MSPPPGDTTSPHDALPPAPPPAPPQAPRRRWLTALLCTVIFAAGGIVGSGATAVVLVRRAQDAVRHPEELPRRFALRLQRRLDLRPAQTERVEAIFARHQRTLLDARERMLRQAEPELHDLEEDVAAVLDPGQVEPWRRHYRTLRDDWLPRAPRHAPERPPRPRGAGDH